MPLPLALQTRPMSPFSFFSRSFFRPASRPDAIRLASAPASLVAFSMATYFSTVSKRSDEGPLPEDVAAKPHHITKHGEVVGFKNPHESYGGGLGLKRMWNAVLWCAQSWNHHSSSRRATQSYIG